MNRMRSSQHLPAPRRAPRRGFGLLDGLIGLALLAFGLLGLTGLQTRLVAQTTDAQARSTANQLANELLATALVDPNNLDCYRLPAGGTCANSVALANTATWATRVGTALPGTVTATSTRTGTRLVVVIGWSAKDEGTPRSLTAETDVD